MPFPARPPAGRIRKFRARPKKRTYHLAVVKHRKPAHRARSKCASLVSRQCCHRSPETQLDRTDLLVTRGQTSVAHTAQIIDLQRKNGTTEYLAAYAPTHLAEIQQAVLAVEDEAPIRMQTVASLEEWGLNVLEAENGAEAWPSWNSMPESTSW